LLNIIYFFLRFLKNSRINTDPEYRRFNKKELLKEVFSKSENLNDLNYSNNQLKESIRTLREQNNNLRAQVRELKQHIENLEKANSELLEQKTKLEKSIVLGEELHVKKEKLFATAVHDIKNPAAAIKGYVELLESFDLNAVEQQEIIKYLVDTSSRIVDLAQKMSVAIAQSETNAEPNFESSSLKLIIDSVCYQNIANANRKQIKLINNASPQTPKIEIDKEKMHEAIDNIVNNAIKFSYPNSTVIIKSYFNEKKIFIEVIDNGVGMNPEDLDHLFVKGAKLSSKPTGSEESSGLGLWIVKNIIDEHGGIITVASKKNTGSTFKIELPLKRKK
jgi:signal transduction histidine kinase